MHHLRPHHFLCILTYSGKGYSDVFVAGFNALTGAINAGDAQIEIVEGIRDDLCSMRHPDEKDYHCRNPEIMMRDLTALGSLNRLFDVTGQDRISFGSVVTLTPELIGSLRQAFASGELRDACPGCEWSDLCTKTGLAAFEGARLGC